MTQLPSLTRPTLTRKGVFFGAVPIMVAASLAPLVSLVDIWVVGNYIGKNALAAIGLGTVIYGLFYWGFGFLRMSTSGLSAQADGAGDERAVQAHLFRAVPMGLLIGLSVVFLQGFLLAALFVFFPAEGSVTQGAHAYLHARLWGLPATLASLALMGWFIGLARPKRALYMQIVLNVINAPLSILLVGKFGLGVYGVGIASAIAEWGGLLAGLILAGREINSRGGFDKTVIKLKSLLHLPALKKLASANGNIFIRTMALNFGFLFFAAAAAKQGTLFLAGFAVLMQFITMTALVLDSFANVAEAHVGAAYGAKDSVRFDKAVRLTSESAAFFAVFCGLAIYFAGPFVIDILTPDLDVRASARQYLPFCALVPLVGAGAWQLDGIFIGVTRTAAMRNAGIAAVILYLLAHYILAPRYGGAGVWSAFLFYYIARAVTMFPAWSGIKRDVRG
ncbi:MAG: MATE family efflux transporter [Robiginitomaculum sp.]|nr:MATE family efflux transporter [Robiginitomaculum sp.]